MLFRSGPLDSIVLVDTEAEMLAAMNASNGALVASIATDDPSLSHRISDELQAFKIGINAPRSRGDREEIFGGKGASWKGAFVGGDLLVQAVTQPADGSEDRLYDNFPGYSLYPPITDANDNPVAERDQMDRLRKRLESVLGGEEPPPPKRPAKPDVLMQALPVEVRRLEAAANTVTAIEVEIGRAHV